MATIVQRPGKNGQQVYRVQVRRKGSPPLSATFTKLSDARKWIQVTEAAIVEGRHFKSAEAKRHTLADLIDRYCTDVLPRKGQRTVYNQIFDLHWWKARLGHYALADVTPALLAESRDRLARDHKNSTVHRYLGTLSHAFSVAVREWGWLEDSPMRKVSKPKQPRGRVRYLSDEERAHLLAECQASRNPHLYIVVMLALSCGARKTELVSLRWADVDLKRGTLTFHETKNGERRTVPLTGQAHTLMQQHARVRRLNTLLVFPNAEGKQFFRFREAFENAVKRAGIKDFHFHDCLPGR